MAVFAFSYQKSIFMHPVPYHSNTTFHSSESIKLTILISWAEIYIELIVIRVAVDCRQEVLDNTQQRTGVDCEQQRFKAGTLRYTTVQIKPLGSTSTKRYTLTTPRQIRPVPLNNPYPNAKAAKGPQKDNE